MTSADPITPLLAALADVLARQRQALEAGELSQAGRLGVYDIAVHNQHDELIALVRGRSYRLRGKPVAGA